MFGISLPSRVKYWMTEVDHDCYFIVGHEGEDIQRIGATKIFLMGNSSVFRAMFKDSDLAEIRITDIEPNVFRNFLTCCYSGNDAIIKSLDFKELVKLLQVSDKYLAYEMTNEILKRLRELFCFDNIFYVLSNPCCAQNSYLDEEIKKILNYDFKKVTSDARFLELDVIAMEWILKQENLMVNELDIWKAIIRWAKCITGSEEGSVIRPYIKDLLKYFRFLTMEFTDFWQNVVSCGVLLQEEVISLCKAFGTNDPSNIEGLNQTFIRRYRIGDHSSNIRSSIVSNPLNASIFCTVNLGDVFSPGPWKQSINSVSYIWANYIWMVQIFKIKSNTAQKSLKKKYALSVYVVCHGLTSAWKCQADIDFELFCRGKPNVKKYFTKCFTEKSTHGGDACFHDWVNLVDPMNGFIKESNIFLMVRIQLNDNL